MKKLLYFAGLVLCMASCTEDYTDWVEPQQNPAEESQTVTLAVTPVTNPVDFATATGDSIQLFVPTITAVEGSETRYVVTLFNDDQSKSVELTPDDQGRVAAADLKDAVAKLYGKAPVAHDIAMTITTYTMIAGQSVKNVANSTINVKLTAPHISEAYYVVGGALDWGASAASKEQKFQHSGQNVYDDPIFTIMIAASSGDTWLAIGDDEACDAITNDADWSKLLGTTAGNGDTSLTGSLAPRSELGHDGSICLPASLGASYFKITLDMMEYTFIIEPIVIAAQYYLVGALQGWNDSADGMTCLLTPDAEGTLSYTTKWEGDHNMKIWAGNNFGNWDVAYGAETDGAETETGNLINSGAGAIKCPESDTFYTLTIDLSSMTYKWTKLADQAPAEYTSISLIGEFSGWGSDFDLTEVTPHNWYAVFTQENDGELKFRANHDWGINWGFDGWNVSEGFNKVGVNNAGNITVPAGTYKVYFNDITASMMILAQ